MFSPAFQDTPGVELILLINLVVYEESYKEKAASKMVIEAATIRYLFIGFKLKKIIKFRLYKNWKISLN